MERFYLNFYKDIRVLTISNSTKKELLRCGFPAKRVTTLPMGISRINAMHIKKESNPTLIFVGRLNKMKGVEDAIKAVAIASKTINNLQLWVVGKGEEEFMFYLKNLAENEKINVIFWNHVSQHKKFELMRRANAIVVPSMREGFGLIVPEAGSVGTPAIVYDVHGLRDIVIDGVNGIKVDVSPEKLANGIELLFSDKKKYKAMSIAAKKQSVQYNWDNTAKKALSVINNEL
jgi:glycosyltransferase involved in cell wall biosynthesis